MTKIAKLLCAFLFTFGLGFVPATTASAQTRIIQEADFGQAWPFTVSGGELRCSRLTGASADLRLGIVTFSVNGVSYAVNGTARDHGFTPIEPIWDFNWAMLDEVAKALGITVEQAKEQSPIRINIGPIIDAGLALCGR